MAEPDIATSADEEQNDGYIKDTLEGVGTGIVKGLDEITSKVDTVSGGLLDDASTWLNDNVVDLGTFGVNEDGAVVYGRIAEALKQGGMRCVVIRGNGAYAVGADLDQAWANAAMLEHSMRIVMLTRQANFKV